MSKNLGEVKEVKKVGFLLYFLSKLISKNLDNDNVGKEVLEEGKFVIVIELGESRRCGFTNKNLDEMK